MLHGERLTTAASASGFCASQLLRPLAQKLEAEQRSLAAESADAAFAFLRRRQKPNAAGEERQAFL